MGWTFINSSYAINDAGGTTLDGGTTLNIQEGDLLVALCEWYESGSPTVTISDGGSNELTLLTKQVVNAVVYFEFGYKIAASANATATMTLTFSSSQSYRSLLVLQFRPSAGTVELDTVDLVTSPNTDTSVATDNISTTGTDELIIGGHGIYGAGARRDISSVEIAGESATLALDNTAYIHLWYKTFTETKSNINATGTLSSSATHNEGIISFKLTGGGTIYNMSMSESASIGDSFGGLASFIGSISESNNISDSLSSVAIFIRSISESNAISDLFSSAAEFIGSIFESGTITDSQSSTIEFLSSIFENINISDNLTSLATLFVSLSESSNIQDTIEAIGTFAVSINESTTIEDVFRIVAEIAEFVKIFGEAKLSSKIKGSISKTSDISGEVEKENIIRGSVKDDGN